MNYNYLFIFTLIFFIIFTIFYHSKKINNIQFIKNTGSIPNSFFLNNLNTKTTLFNILKHDTLNKKGQIGNTHVYYGVLANNDLNGFPSMRQMKLFFSMDKEEIYIKTFSNSNKLKEIEKNTKVSILIPLKYGTSYLDIVIKGQIKRTIERESNEFITFQITPEKIVMHHNLKNMNDRKMEIYEGIWKDTDSLKKNISYDKKIPM